MVMVEVDSVLYLYTGIMPSPAGASGRVLLGLAHILHFMDVIPDGLMVLSDKI